MKLINQIETETGENIIGKVQKESLDFEFTDAYYEHNQYNANATWVVNHNLSKKPAVAVVNSANSENELNNIGW